MGLHFRLPHGLAQYTFKRQSLLKGPQDWKTRHKMFQDQVQRESVSGGLAASLELAYTVSPVLSQLLRVSLFAKSG